jgi:cell wall-associated NlpC family hydrolase
MGKKNFYTKLALTTPIIAALIAPSAAYADTANTAVEQVPATFTAPASTGSYYDLVDVNNTKVVELSNEERVALRNVYLDAGDVSIDAVSLNNLQNEAARKAQARGKAMDKVLTALDDTRNELAAKADAEKKAEEEAKVAKLKAEEAKKAEELAAKALADAKSAEEATSATSPTSLNAANEATTVAVQSNSQQAYTPTTSTASNNNTPATVAPATVSGNGTYASNFDVRVADTASKTATSSVDTANLDATRAGIVNTAKTGIGGAYIWGGKTFRAWDCSGFVSWVYAQHGIKLTAYTYAMAGELKVTNSPKPGDIVFQNGYSHVGIYIGDGKMISALNPSEGTIVHSTSIMSVDGYYTAL